MVFFRSAQDYWPVIDTSHIYKYDNLPRATPALADLADCVLKKPIRQGSGAKHSPVEDARTAVELALHQVRGTFERLLPLS